MPLENSCKIDFSAHYIDGKSPLRYDANITLTRDSLRIQILNTNETVNWLYSDIKQVKDIYSKDEVHLKYGDELQQILIIKDHRFISSLKKISPQYTKKFKRSGSDKWIKIVAYTFIAIAVLAVLMHRWIVPALTNYVVNKFPVSWEEKIGQTFITHFATGFGVCEESQLHGQIDIIINKLVETLNKTNYKYNVTIVDGKLVNAFALPGGEIVIFHGLIEKSKRPEEVAGVLAHEIQHIEQRHFAKILVKELSLGILLTLIIGDSQVLGTVLNSANTLRSLAYQRSEESSADAEGLKMLIKAEIDPKGMIDFFEIIKNEHGNTEEVSEYFSTHPDTGDRIGKLDNMIKGSSFKPEKLLPDVNWEETKMLCNKTKESNDVKIDEEEN